MSVKSTPRNNDMADTAQYSLPPLIGINRHDPRKKRAPAYSFGSKYSKFSDDSPGPAYNIGSNVTKYGKDREKGATITGRPTPRVMKDVVPGPIYNADSLSPRYRNPPSYTFGRRSYPNFDGPRPGPTSYSIPTTLGYRVVGYRGTQAATIRGRNDKFGFAHDWSNSPGPAAYDASVLLSRRAPAATLKGRNYLPEYKMVTPGPGAYDAGTYSETKNSPRFTIGVKHSNKSLPLYTLADVSD